MALLRPEQKSLEKQEVEKKTIWWIVMARVISNFFRAFTAGEAGLKHYHVHLGNIPII